jgi:rubrerythrin
MTQPRSLPLKDVRLLRGVLARELDTINEYEEMAEKAEDPRIREFFLHLAIEEKEHVAEAMALIHELDADQAREWSEADTRAEHFLGEPTSSPASPPLGEAAASPRTGWTVGSLKGKGG